MLSNTSLSLTFLALFIGNSLMAIDTSAEERYNLFNTIRATKHYKKMAEDAHRKINFTAEEIENIYKLDLEKFRTIPGVQRNALLFFEVWRALMSSCTETGKINATPLYEIPGVETHSNKNAFEAAWNSARKLDFCNCNNPKLYDMWADSLAYKSYVERK